MFMLLVVMISFKIGSLVSRASIHPSARRSIHDHFNCPFTHNYFPTHQPAMTRYGCRDTQEAGPGQSSQPASGSPECGRDEVDNVMSKMTRPDVLTPLFNPFVDNQSPNAGQSSSRLHSNKAGKTPSPSQYSPRRQRNNSSMSADSTNDRLHFSNSVESSFISEDSDSDKQDHRPNLRHRQTKHSPDYRQTAGSIVNSSTTVTEKNNYSIIWLLVALSLVSGLIAAWFLKNTTLFTKREIVYNEQTYKKDLYHLKDKFQFNKDVILKIQSGIETISKRNDTGSFIFVYNSKNPNHDVWKLDDFVNMVSAMSAQYLRGDDRNRHIIVSNMDLNMKSHTELMHRYRDQLERHGVMLLKDLEDVPHSLAMAFHYYCDEYDPLVKKSAIFFTLDLGKCPDTAESTAVTHAVIERALKERWQELSGDLLGPLLTRVVSVVIDVRDVR